MKYQNLDHFLREHRTTSKENITHTKIGNGKDIYPGKYSIPEEKLQLFYKLYHKHVFVNKQSEYLTEVQLRNNHSPILVDFDFRYETNVKERKHSEEHIIDLIHLYIDKLREVMDINEEMTLPIYILEKDSVIQTEDVTKDGIHMIIQMGMSNSVQEILREKVMEDIGDILDDLNLKNSYDEVLDEGITKGHTNWQMYGSQKPDNIPYKLTYCFHAIIRDEDIDLKKQDIENSVQFITSLMARTPSRTTFPLKHEIQKKIEEVSKKKKNVKLRIVRSVKTYQYSKIKSIQDIQDRLNEIFDNLSVEDYIVKETHFYLMSLPKIYSDDYHKWIRCGMALKYCDERLYYSWLLFSSQSEKFNIDELDNFQEFWEQFNTTSTKSLTERSIMYWAKKENPEKYYEIRKETIDYYIQLTIDTATEWDIAHVLYQLFKDEFRCASLKNNIWYQFKNHRWNEIDKGSSLRYNISRTLSNIYSEKSREYISQCNNEDLEDELVEKYRQLSIKYNEIASKLKRTTFKQNVMKEAAEIFYEKDQRFMKLLDTNRYLLCFTNGVWDFENKIFRNGYPEDYISLCTNIPYYPINRDSEEDVRIINEINDFMYKLFPNKELRRYMWDHLSSTLIGTNKNQTFNIYNGCGSNGKSKLVNIMENVLGDYKGVVPITLVTQKRTSVGSVTPEVAALKGIRYAVMSEPSKSERLNDGLMKQLTGEDPIEARALYKDPITFIPQFKLVVCTNNLFDIKSNDDGTWRRIRLCEFMSKFVENPRPKEEIEEENYYEFKIDKELDKKIEEWKLIFMSLLVERAVEINGDVSDCDIIMSASNEYRKGQDYLLEFFNEKIRKTEGSNRGLKKHEVYTEFKSWYQSVIGKSPPKSSELYDFLNKKLGKHKPNKGWVGYSIEYGDDEEDEEDIIES